MATENPYKPPKTATDGITRRLTPSTRALWLAYFWAPAVAPISFVIIVLAVAVVAHSIGNEVNEAGLVLLPAIALTVGVGSSYLVAGVIGMPIAFLLRRRHALSGYSIHGAALCWALLFSTIASIATVGDNWDSLPIWLCYVGAGVIPPVLLSGTAFWLLVRRYAKLEENTTN